MTVLVSLLAGSLATVLVGFLVGAWIAGYRPNLRMRMVRRSGEWIKEGDDE